MQELSTPKTLNLDSPPNKYTNCINLKILGDFQKH